MPSLLCAAAFSTADSKIFGSGEWIKGRSLDRGAPWFHPTFLSCARSLPKPSLRSVETAGLSLRSTQEVSVRALDTSRHTKVKRQRSVLNPLAGRRLRRRSPGRSVPGPLPISVFGDLDRHRQPAPPCF